MAAACARDFGAFPLAKSFGTSRFSASSATPVRRGEFSKRLESLASEFQWPGSQGARRLCPRHFHLLSEQDLDDLRLISETILRRCSEIVRDWYQQYVLHFGDSRTFPQHGLARIFEDALQNTLSALIRGDIDEYAAEVSHLGKLLAEHRVALDEVITSLRLFRDKRPWGIGARADQIARHSLRETQPHPNPLTGLADHNYRELAAP